MRPTFMPVAKEDAALNAGHLGFAPRPKGCSPPPCGGLKIAFLALCSVNGCPIIPTTWGLSAYCPLTHTGTLAAICRTKSGLFDAFLCFFGAFWCSLAAGLRDAGMQLCCIDTAQRLPAAAGRTAAEDKGAWRLAPKTRQGAAARQRQTQAGGRIARAERRAACAQDQAGEQGATASRPKRGAHSPRPRQPQGKRSEPKLETPRPREPRRSTGRRRRANPKQPQQQPQPPRTSGGTTSAGGGGRRPGRTRTQAAALETDPAGVAAA